MPPDGMTTIRSPEEFVMSVRDAVNQIDHRMRSCTLPEHVTVKMLTGFRTELRQVLEHLAADSLPVRDHRRLRIGGQMSSQAEAWSQPELQQLCRQLIRIEHYYRHVL